MIQLRGLSYLPLLLTMSCLLFLSSSFPLSILIAPNPRIEFFAKAMMRPPVAKKVKHEMAPILLLGIVRIERKRKKTGISNSSSVSLLGFRYSFFLSPHNEAEIRCDEEMEFHSSIVPIVLLCLLSNLRSAIGLRFVIDREECFSHSVPYEGDTVHVSFVVIKADTWHYGEDGVDLVVKGPAGEQIHDSRDKTSDKFEFVVHKKGLHRFCFTNKSPYHETIDFDIHVGHFAHFDQHAKDEHFNPLLDQIAKLEEALYNVQFEQHWLEAQTDRQALINEGMSRRAIHKSIFESAALIGASVLQVYLLRRLFERKLSSSRV
ncbi:hypothetical protein MRB53_028663 [Persea americana]|uniref:Uncharacterized protein n=1 Tax=Persea americana TaxID=3435 RepID=A0ACC2KG60_PERAE|nr:hypothetical protein MRB53_028663 [Persea americana]